MAGGLLLAMGSLSSCKGRTAENMEPTADTVEVEISAVSDSQAYIQTPAPAVSDGDSMPEDAFN